MNMMEERLMQETVEQKVITLQIVEETHSDFSPTKQI